VSVKYKELSFTNEEERLKAVRRIKEDSEVSLPGKRVVRIRRETYRVSLHNLKGQFFLVHEPRAVEYLPRVWLVVIPGFQLCEIPIGKPMQVCNRVVRAVAVDDSELVYVCAYHGSGLRVFRGEFVNQLKAVPKSLCAGYCSYCIKVNGLKYDCRAFMPCLSLEEESKRRRLLKGMSLLCLEDWWWRRYLRRHELE